MTTPSLFGELRTALDVTKHVDWSKPVLSQNSREPISDVYYAVAAIALFNPKDLGRAMYYLKTVMPEDSLAYMTAEWVAIGAPILAERQGIDPEYIDEVPQFLQHWAYEVLLDRTFPCLGMELWGNAGYATRSGGGILLTVSDWGDSWEMGRETTFRSKSSYFRYYRTPCPLLQDEEHQEKWASVVEAHKGFEVE